MLYIKLSNKLLTSWPGPEPLLLLPDKPGLLVLPEPGFGPGLLPREDAINGDVDNLFGLGCPLKVAWDTAGVFIGMAALVV